MKITNAFYVSLSFIFVSCTHTAKYPQDFHDQEQQCAELDDGLSGVSSDPTYGYAMENAVRIGGGGSENELKYMQMLLGPQKELIESVFKAGSFWGNGLTLSGYKVVINGDTLPKIIYLDSHHCRDPKAPVGFNVKEEFHEVKSKSDGENRAYEVPRRYDPK
jgi:hypothetical protein